MLKNKRYNVLQGGILPLLMWILLSTLLLTGLTSCIQRDPSPNPAVGQGDFYLSMSVAPQPTFKKEKVPLPDLKQTLDEAENKVASIRVLIFNHTTGQCLVNQLLEDYRISKDNASWSRPVLIPGDVKSFDFYFVANEVSKSYNLTTALLGVTQLWQLYTLPALTHIAWQPEFFPKTGSNGEEDLIPMTAICPNISLDAIKQMLGQGTEQDPYRFLAKNGKRTPVRLTRVLARIDIKIPSVMANSTPGDRTTDEVLALSYIDKFEMSLVNVPRYFALFASRYYEANQWTASVYSPINKNYYFNSKDYQDCYYIEDDTHKIRRNMELTAGSAVGAIGELNWTDYYTILYVPEFIRPKSADDGLTKDQLAAMKIRLTFQVNNSDPQMRTPGRDLVYNYPLLDDFDKRRSPKEGQLSPNNDGVSNNSVIRNTHYKITLKELEP